MSFDRLPWAGPGRELGRYVAEASRRTLRAYRSDPALVQEHANQEHDTSRGGYADRQLAELAQNGADALAEVEEGGRIVMRLTDDHLYCADNGEPMDEDGVTALKGSHLSPKRGTNLIGRFGLGFKAVLGVSDRPEFFSRNVSFRFDPAAAERRIRQAVAAGDSKLESFPTLRLPEPVDPHGYRERDPVLRGLMEWASNIVRLPLKEGARSRLLDQMDGFPGRFLLFVEHVRSLKLIGPERESTWRLESHGGRLYTLSDGVRSTEWRVFSRRHMLSEAARSDSRSTDDAEECVIRWAAPLGGPPETGRFWAYFPTQTASLVSGIVNAPWKTNEDRQNLLPGAYNDELIDAAAELIANNLSELATRDDPAKHLDALPRRAEAGDSLHSMRLRTSLLARLAERELVPDQDGRLRGVRDVSYPPRLLTGGGQGNRAALERWATYPGRPRNWLHGRAMTRDRWAKIVSVYLARYGAWVAEGASPGAWLEALVVGQPSERRADASMAAIQTAALLKAVGKGRVQLSDLGTIVLMADGKLRVPDPDSVFLPDWDGDGSKPHLASEVDGRLVDDLETRRALEQLGIVVASAQSRFADIARLVLGWRAHRVPTGRWAEFWELSRQVEVREAVDTLGTGLGRLHVRTLACEWAPVHSVLLPGEIVDGNTKEDAAVTVDVEYHRDDRRLLLLIGVAWEQVGLPEEPWFWEYMRKWRNKFREREIEGVYSTPRDEYLDFSFRSSSGPLEVLKRLSPPAAARYTESLLGLDSTYEAWTMKHSTEPKYGTLACESPTIDMIRQHGWIETADGPVPFAHALGPAPRNSAALYGLLQLPDAHRIREAFELAEPEPVVSGESDPVPLVDIWPGLRPYLRDDQRDISLRSCAHIGVAGRSAKCVLHAGDVYVAGHVAESEQLGLVADRLALSLSDGELQAVLDRQTAQEIEDQRAAVRDEETDAARLLKAVGEDSLRAGLGSSTIAVLESERGPLGGEALAEAVIAIHHTDSLRQFKSELKHLGPPKQWAGSSAAVSFVQSLGFPREWAGQRGRRRNAYVEIPGPFALPPLHDYQATIVANVRRLLRFGTNLDARRRGMISLPTGSGKTRVAVQALVEARRDDRFGGDILWVADRDELCEQAVESWRQVWSSAGGTDTLRVSRMWGSQRSPERLDGGFHVIVATIQTLRARLEGSADPGQDRARNRFLDSVGVVVVDEAHRSIAPSYTSAMRELRLTRWQRSREPFLIGLTATPYRGYNEEETLWLTRRYAGNRLDSGAFASDDAEFVVRTLQDREVLAEVDHEIIPGGEFTLQPSEIEQTKKAPWLPRSAELRLAQDADRTRRILDAYHEHVPPDWPTLVFATSVEHAGVLAALLSADGIRARAVSGYTEIGVRRRIVEEFRGGEIQVLVNYAVFREGFDAPRTRAIVVARPVYSPNLYFQMIGRGMRGVRNGGNDRCLVLNVRDNIRNFDRALAFTELDWVWAR